MKKLMLVLVIGMFLISFAFAETYVCCEKTLSGAWCQNVLENQCDETHKMAPTSCEFASYCKLGCCYNPREGTCMQNTPEQVCNDKNGIWDPSQDCDVPQCNLGCCLMGDQAAFVTQTRCKALSSMYGLNTNFRTDLRNELSCIASASSGVKGACVFEEEFQTTCRFTTQKECTNMKDAGTETDFYPRRLCSDSRLNTICGPSEKTTCVEGKDEVYFLDTCGNIANIYDYDKKDNQNYWSEVYSYSEVCGNDGANIHSQKCGNCDYYHGSTCMNYKDAQKNSEKNIKSPLIGDFICADLGCNDEEFKKEKGRNPMHGETWCVSNAEVGFEKMPGARDFRLVCYNGEITIEPCADYKGEICIESEIEIAGESSGFSNAMCKANRWQYCFGTKGQSECENRNLRDCVWDNSLKKCFPLNPPGFNFWGNDESTKICSSGSEECLVEYKQDGYLSDFEVEGNPDCIKSDWEKNLANACQRIGDCGNSPNFLGFSGTSSGTSVKISGKTSEPKMV